MALLKKSASTSKVPYTFDEDAKILKMVEGGSGAKAISEEVGRTVHSIRYRISWLQGDKCPNTLPELKAQHAAKSKK